MNLPGQLHRIEIYVSPFIIFRLILMVMAHINVEVVFHARDQTVMK